ncbi:MAG: LamG-like jellyroll fold domain-containing protein, partial [Betaproteobacteria bacterium]
MSIKDLFGRQVLSDKNKKDLASDIESADNLKAIKTKQDSFVPQVNYDNPDTFAKYGSANLYYKSAIDRIINYYPYDGSDAEINTFYNKSLDIEKYIFDKKYPRTTGYITLSPASTSTSIVRNGYGLPTTLEYITFNGGPNTVSETGKLSTLIPDPTNSKFQYNNLYDDNLYVNNGYPSDYGSGTRESNLKSDFDTGVTVEFWTLTGSIQLSSTEKQVVFDMWNNNASSSADYGRITIELDGTATAASPWLITVQSGSTGIFQQTLGQDLNLNSLEDWKHYAFVFQNSGSDFHAKLYVNGELEDTNIYTSTTIGELTPNAMQGRLGALLTAPATLAVGGVLPSAYIGAGKLSGSIDEFRFWKTARNAEQIGRNWFTQIRGGVNTDIANTTLGMYYKFNEGITGTSSIDSVVLDYGGRVCNGTWTGYSSVSRNTGSAIVSASAANFEYLDPIIYDTHPDVVTLKSDLEATGLYHDRQNSTQFINLIPSWVLEEVQNDGGADGDSDLEKLAHIMGAYFDKLYLQISALPALRQEQYTSSSYKPLPFAQNLPQSLGMTMPEIFVDANVLEKFTNRNDSELYENDLNDTKNLIYQNLYNSLTSIYKSKGTERSIRNVLRCFNVDDNLIYFKTYSDNQTYELNTNTKQTLKKKKRLNFNTASAAHAVMYQDADPAIPDSQGYISGGTSQPEIDGVPSVVYEATGSQDRYGFTVESSIYFPRFFNIADSYQRNFFTASLFGMQTVFTGSTGTGYAGGTTSLTGAQDIANFQVYAIRDDLNSRNVRFKLTSSFDPHPFDALESQTFMSAYNSENWNLSVGLRPTKKFSGFVSGSDDYGYEVVFRGYNNKLGTINNSFALSASISSTVGKNMIRSNKRLYVGAQNTNLTGANI